jgi:hypothetical protein
LLEKKSDFKTICFKKNQKILRCNSRRKLQKHGKKKNDKDEFGNILLKHVLPVYNLALNGVIIATCFSLCGEYFDVSL